MRKCQPTMEKPKDTRFRERPSPDCASTVEGGKLRQVTVNMRMKRNLGIRRLVPAQAKAEE